MKRLLLTAAAFCLLIAACKKSEDGNATGSRSEILTRGKWRITSMTAYFKNPITANDTTVDMFASVDACAKDDLYLFLSNSKVSINQGSNKCDTGAAQEAEAGTWALNAAQDTLILDGVLPLGRTFAIKSFSDASMQLQRDSNIGGFMPIKVLADFTHE
jgi:hypothetical protein